MLILMAILVMTGFAKFTTIEKDINMIKPQLEQLKGEVSQQSLKVVGCIDNMEIFQESLTRHSVT